MYRSDADRSAATPWPAPRGPAVGWHGKGAARAYFDGSRWVRDDPPSLTTALAVVAVLAVSLLVARPFIELGEAAGVPVPILAVSLIVLGYLPPVAVAVALLRRDTAGIGWLSTVGGRFRGVDIAWGVLVWFIAIIVQAVVFGLVDGFGVPVSDNTGGLGDDSIGADLVVITAVAAVLVAPLVEEFVFRGVVQRALIARIGTVPGVAAQGMLFGVAHIDPVAGVGNIGLALVLSGVGIIFGAAVVRFGRLGPAIVAHAVFNAVVVALVVSGAAEHLVERVG